MGAAHFSRSPRPPVHLRLLHVRVLLLLLALCAFTSASVAVPASPSAAADSSVKGDGDDNDDGDDDTPTPTTAPIYLPHYDQDDWSLVRGSIISKNVTANETTYTIFCPTETPPACDLALEFPFVIIEGPRTLKFHGTITSAYTANLECDLNGTAAATCSGYTSYKSGYSDGLRTGPTEVTWTSAYHGAQVQWGTLTMTDVPSKTADPLGVTMTTGGPAFESSGDLYYMPTPTDEGAGVRVDRRWAAAGAALGGIVAAGVVI